MEFKIIKANLHHVEQIGKLFDLYRQFYKYDSDIIQSTNYIQDRIINNESKIFIAINKDKTTIRLLAPFAIFFVFWRANQDKNKNTAIKNNIERNIIFI